ncbi:MAG: hypothetical protein WC901_03000 [Candidatus Margulisiibacteriota bacterium]
MKLSAQMDERRLIGRLALVPELRRVTYVVSQGPLCGVRLRRWQLDKGRNIFFINGLAAQAPQLALRLLKGLAPGWVRSLAVKTSRAMDFFPAPLEGFHAHAFGPKRNSPLVIRDILKQLSGQTNCMGLVAIRQGSSDQVERLSSFSHFVAPIHGFQVGQDGQISTFGLRTSLNVVLGECFIDIESLRQPVVSAAIISKESSARSSAVPSKGGTWRQLFVSAGSEIDRTASGLLPVNQVIAFLRAGCEQGLLHSAHIGLMPLGGICGPMDIIWQDRGKEDAEILFSMETWPVSATIADNIQNHLLSLLGVSDCG